jgi:hypothetical protein
MDASTISAVNLTLRLNSNGATLDAPVTYSAAARTATLTPASALSAPRSYTVTVASAVKDSAGNHLTSEFQFVFNTGDGTAPTVVSVVPPDGKTGATIGSVVRVTFSEAMDPSSFGVGSITLASTTNGGVSGAITYDAGTKTATFTPTQLLRESNTYKAAVSTAVRDQSGLTVAAPFQWSFITVDNTAPTVSVFPVRYAVGSSSAVERNAEFTVTFSEPIDRSTVNASTVALRDFATNNNVAGTIAFDSTNQFGKFTPSAPLVAGARYNFVVTTGVKDVSGNALTQDFQKDFFVIFPSDTTAPEIVSISPADGESGVRTIGIVTVTFNEFVDISATSFLLRNAATGALVDAIVSQAPNFGPQRFILTPRFELDKNTRYTVTLTTGVKDWAGNPLPHDTSFSFTTAP